jgi:hypothetical protein
MPTSNISWHTSIYTQADTQQDLDSLNGAGIPIFLQISLSHIQESLQSQLHGVVKAY